MNVPQNLSVWWDLQIDQVAARSPKRDVEDCGEVVEDPVECASIVARSRTEAARDAELVEATLWLRAHLAPDQPGGGVKVMQVHVPKDGVPAHLAHFVRDDATYFLGVDGAGRLATKLFVENRADVEAALSALGEPTP
jgi:hypothetical protein